MTKPYHRTRSTLAPRPCDYSGVQGPYRRESGGEQVAGVVLVVVIGIAFAALLAHFLAR